MRLRFARPLRRPSRTGSLFVLVGLLSACGVGTVNSGAGFAVECSDHGECDAGSLCIDQACAPVCAADSHCAPDEACVEQTCLPMQIAECRSDADCKQPNLCQVADGASCQTGRCIYAPLRCDSPPPAGCTADDSLFRSYAAPGVCDPTTGGCQYPSIDTACEACSINCLGLCDAVTCDDVGDACRAGACVPGMPPTCDYVPRSDRIACTATGGAPGECEAGACQALPVECADDGTDAATGLCLAACGAAEPCQGVPPRTGLPTCSDAGRDSVLDRCDPQCSVDDRLRKTCGSGGDCTGAPLCDGMKAGGDACTLDCQPRADLPGTNGFVCMPVGRSYSDGFFALESFAGKLYAGQFGYGHEDKSMLFSYVPWKLVRPGIKGISESVCALKEFNGKLFANTESSGDIYKSEDGSRWTRIYDGANLSIGCGLEVFKTKLYAINYDNGSKSHGRIMRKQGRRWVTTFDSGREGLYLREIVKYHGKLYAFGVANGHGVMLWSRDGENWRRRQVGNRYFRGHVWGGYLWLSSTVQFSSDGEAGIWRFDGTNFVKMRGVNKKYVTEIEDLDGELFAATSDGWKADTGRSSVLHSTDGGTTWSQICRFDEIAAWSMAVHDGRLFVGTWQYGGRGKVYEVRRVAP